LFFQPNFSNTTRGVNTTSLDLLFQPYNPFENLAIFMPDPLLWLKSAKLLASHSAKRAWHVQNQL
jgi:hypothetical protein